LTTTLAHSSGQWVSSQWPVCLLADIASPHRMGAALTYARRYALFTLVGIAGEDDLDAPDLCAPAPIYPPVVGVQVQPRTSGNGRMGGAGKTASSIVLPTDQSAALRDRLIGEIAGVESQDSAAAWAREALPLKNTLADADARLVETAFALRQSAFSLSTTPEPSPSDLLDTPRPPVGTCTAAATSPAADPNPAAIRTSDRADADERARIDKSVLTISTPKRYRNKEHLRFVAQHACILCDRKPSEAHHIRFVQPRALGRKASDEFAIPLCRSHHRALHRAGDEKAWWQQAGIDPVKIARKLWKLTRMHEPRIRPAVLTQNAAAERPAESDGQVPSGPATT
jgi:hypothetical protein